MPLKRYVWRVVAATFLVAVCPILVVWWLRTSGAIGSTPLGMVLAMGLSLGASYLGSAFWETRAGSGDLLFGELMVWGFVRRWRAERRLASALQMIGPMNHAQTRATGGLTAESQANALEQLGAAMEATDPYTHGHSRRVARHSWMIARRMGLPREQVARIRTAAAVHDVGKIETPTPVLRKPGVLTDEEFDVIKRHPVDGARMAAVLGDAELTSIVRHHHERLDGTGYPSALSGKEIPLGARIIAVADTFDAITSARPYRSARPHKKAIDILKYEAGTALDPTVVRAFCGVYSGRRPLALWASVTSLPGQVFSWVGGGVAGVASVAQVAAVAAVAAAGTATVARPVTDRHPMRAATTTSLTVASDARAAQTTPTQLPVRASAAATPRQHHVAHKPATGSHASGSLPGPASGGGSSGPSPSSSPSSEGGSGNGKGPTPSEGGSGKGKGPTPSEGGSGKGPTPSEGGSGKGPTPSEGGSGKGPTPSEGGSGKGPTPSEGGSGKGPTPSEGGSSGSGKGKIPASG